MLMLIQEIVTGSQTAYNYNFLSRTSQNTLGQETRDNNNSCLNCMSAASSQILLQRMSNSKYLEIAVMPTPYVIEWKSYYFILQSCTVTRANIWRWQRIADATCTIMHKRLWFDSPHFRKHLTLWSATFTFNRVKLEQFNFNITYANCKTYTM